MKFINFKFIFSNFQQFKNNYVQKNKMSSCVFVIVTQWLGQETNFHKLKVNFQHLRQISIIGLLRITISCSKHQL